MVYKNVVNEELRIAAIHIEDLDLRYAKNFLEQWENGAKLKELTLYYDYENDYLVLNRDRKDYKDYLDITEDFLTADYNHVMEVRDKISGSLKETLGVLEACRIYRKIKQELQIIEMQSVVGATNTYIGKMFDVIRRDSSSPVFNMSHAYNYGFICGKRAERARRKRGTAE